MAAAAAEKNRQIKELERKNDEKMKKLSEEAMKQSMMLKAAHAEAMEATREQIHNLEKQQENYRKIIEKKNYEASYPKPLDLKNHQKKHPKAFYIQILGCRGAGKSTFLNRFFQFSGIRKYLNELT